jgi:hypothetical protein
MRIDRHRAAALAAVLTTWLAAPVAGQHQHPTGQTTMPGEHAMWSVGLGGGWTLLGMGQVFPIVTVGAPLEDDSPLRDTGWYLTQTAFMANVESASSRFVLRTTVDFEGLTQDDGELTFGAWGEGFLDRRHPHTILHEAMVSFNAWNALGGAASLSAGRGFAPFGTDDPMSRPAVKYPTNHHLSQVLERWTISGAFLRGGWSIEAGVFAGTEPDGPYDLSNIRGFGESWSARVAKRWGPGSGPFAKWEASFSFGNVSEDDGAMERTNLWNVALRHDSPGLYALLEGSLADPRDDDNWFSVLGEARLVRGAHRPYARIELATRPEFVRLGAPGTDDFFRYDHDAEPIGATRWLIATLGYGYEATKYPVSVRPFAEVQYNRVSEERGVIEPETLFGADNFWALSLGARIFLGGDPMRMGTYGVLDPMTVMHRTAVNSQQSTVNSR